MARRRSPGVSGAAVLAATMGVYFMYAGVKDVGALEGLRTLLRGERPTPRGGQGSELPWRTLEGLTGAPGGAVAGALGGLGASGPVASTDPGNWAYNLDPSLARALERFAGASGGRVQLRPGSGWRSYQRQVELRQKNGCPDTHRSPASSCRVPTAIPGTSKHERVPAQAFDLTYTGNGADWARLNAGRYGLHFPVRGENWHAELRTVVSVVTGGGARVE